jgi:hypothetical protein
MDKRVIIDCRDFPNEIGCTLLISGSAKEVFNIAFRHSIEEHGHKDTPELRKQLRAMMKPESIKKLKLRSQTTKQKGITK